MGKNFKTIDEAVIRFAGDSGWNALEWTFTETTAIVGNDLAHYLISSRVVTAGSLLG